MKSFYVVFLLTSFNFLNAQNIDHSVWDQLLAKHVSANGQVDYEGLLQSETTLDGYITMIKAQDPAALSDRKTAMAYWINAYNAFTIKLILDNYPIKSIKDIDNGNPWDVKWIEIGANTYSLNNIEHDILRKEYPDARIHFVVNCAAKSCPPLPNKAATAENLELLLEESTTKFVNNRAFNTIEEENSTISKIFDWYAVDFPNLVGFLSTYSGISIAANSVISFKKYDWALNGK